MRNRKGTKNLKFKFDLLTVLIVVRVDWNAAETVLAETCLFKFSMLRNSKFRKIAEQRDVDENDLQVLQEFCKLGQKSRESYLELFLPTSTNEQLKLLQKTVQVAKQHLSQCQKVDDTTLIKVHNRQQD